MSSSSHIDYTQRTLISKLFANQGNDFKEKEVIVAGWVRSVRELKGFSFIVLNDGSSQDSLQLVADHSIEDYALLTSALTGTCLVVRGKVIESQGKNQSIEMQVISANVLGKVDESYPLQKKATSLEFLRENAHLRVRTNLFGAIFRLRHTLSMAVHRFFDQKNFYYLHSPILTAIDAEGAGEMFTVTAKNLEKLDSRELKSGVIDFSSDYFGRAAHLCVTGQLEAETFALGLGQVYTFGPTFRAENSNTHRHLSEFWMIEPEAAFMGLEENAELACDFVKFLIQEAFDKCSSELQALDQYHKFSAKQEKRNYSSHLDDLKKVLDSKVHRITYTEAVDILEKSNQNFEYTPQWGKELQTEHERFLSEKHFKGPVVVTDYPKDCKAFYMKLNPDGKTVRAMDVLVPGVGEIIGGSQREDDLEALLKRIDEMGMNKEALWWYIDLRKFGGAPHSGFGLGFERALMYISGMKNIRDVIAYPRTPRHCDF